MTTTTAPAFKKEITFDRETHDYAMRLDDELIGFARTYHEAEVTLDLLVFDLLSHGVMPDTTPIKAEALVTIALPGLVERTIHVTAESTATIMEHAAGANVWYALCVDGQHYDLVMWKHTIGRPEHLTALDAALEQVRYAIAQLNPPLDITELSVPTPRMTPAEPHIGADPMDAYAAAYDTSVLFHTVLTASEPVDFDAFFASEIAFPEEQSAACAYARFFADEQPRCYLCDDAGTMVIRENNEILHVCQSCFVHEYQLNETKTTSWEVVYPGDYDYPTTDAPRIDAEVEQVDCVNGAQSAYLPNILGTVYLAPSTPQGPPPPLPPLVAVGGDDPHLPPTVIDPYEVRRSLNNPLLMPGIRVALQMLTPAQFGRQVLAHAVLTGQLPSAIERRWIRLTTPQPWDVVKIGSEYGGCYGGEVLLRETDRARCEQALVAMHRARFAPFLPPAAAALGRAA